jgi:hypothetical protein
MGEPGGPAEAERAVHQDLVTADREVGADLEAGPAELVLDLLIPLPGPVADPVDPHDLGQPGRRVRTARLARAAGAGQVRDQVPGGLIRQGARVGGRDHQAPRFVRSPPAQGGISSPPGLGVPVAERARYRRPVARIPGPAPGQRAGGFHRGMRVLGPGPGPPVRPQRHHERQPGLRQLGPEPVLIPVGAVRGHRPERKPRLPRQDGQARADGQLGPERRVILALREMPGRGIRHRVHRVIDPLVSPDRGHGDHPVVGLAVPAQPLPSHVRRLDPVLAVPGVVDHQHPAAMRRRRRITAQQLQPAVIDPAGIPPRLRQEELQPLHRRVLRSRDGLGPGQRGQRLVPVPRRQQPRQVLPEPPPLRQPPEQVIKPRRVLLQRARRRRAGTASRHHAPHTRSSHYSPA